jgi:hypothetical protein
LVVSGNSGWANGCETRERTGEIKRNRRKILVVILVLLQKLPLSGFIFIFNPSHINNISSLLQLILAFSDVFKDKTKGRSEPDFDKINNQINENGFKCG